MFCVVLEHRRNDEVLILRYFASDNASELKTYMQLTNKSI